MGVEKRVFSMLGPQMNSQQPVAATSGGQQWQQQVAPLAGTEPQLVQLPAQSGPIGVSVNQNNDEACCGSPACWRETPCWLKILIFLIGVLYGGLSCFSS